MRRVSRSRARSRPATIERAAADLAAGREDADRSGSAHRIVRRAAVRRRAMSSARSRVSPAPNDAANSTAALLVPAEKSVASAAAPAAGVALPLNGTLVVFLGGLFLFAFVGMLIVARPVLVPMTAAALLAMTLMPAVNRLRGWGLPRPAAVLVVAVALVAGIVVVGWLLVEPLGNALDTLPLLEGVGQRLARLGRRIFGTPYIDWLSERLNEAMPTAALSTHLFGGVGEAVALVLTTFVLTFFLLLSGDLFLQKLIRVLPRIRDKLKALKVVNSVQEDVGRYFATVTLVNIVMGSIAGAIGTWFELPAPMLLAVLVALFNYVPYLGGIVNTLLLLVAATAVYPSLGETILPPLAYAVCALIEGHFVTPLIVGRRTQLNAVTVVFGLVFWAWVWGIPGMALAIPLLLVVKGFAMHIEHLEAVGEFMGR
jgi:predicted PurR-regulated permease PerM